MVDKLLAYLINYEIMQELFHLVVGYGIYSISIYKTIVFNYKIEKHMEFIIYCSKIKYKISKTLNL